MEHISLNDGWKLYEAPLTWGGDRLAQVLRQEDSAYACCLPCDVRMPLIVAGAIEDPVEADNFRQSMWVEQRSWWFVRDFEWQCGDYGAVELTLDRLDFGADIFLNGVHIGRHDSVHYPFVKDIREWLLNGRNELGVRLTCGHETVSEADVSGIEGAVSTEEGNGYLDRGDRRRPFLRKPQYAVGWDWGPRVVTCGMGSASIETYGRAAIRNVMFSTRSVEGGYARVRVSIALDSLLPVSTQDADVEVSLALGGSGVAAAKHPDVLLLSGRNWLDFDLEIPDARLWWPNGYGGQPLYSLEVKVLAGGITEVYGPISVGIRTLELDTARLDGANRRFAFKVNGVPVQCKGGNWIPSDSLYARITDVKYERLLSEAREANFTMLRVWGGGLYEKDIFYNLCDRMGILLWHDFMFACAAYPDYLDEFRRQVYNELDYQTLRLGGRACMAVFCGSNENYWLYHAANPRLGGLHVYGQLEPAAVHRNCPHVPWWPSSPYGGALPNDNNAGGRHLWPDFMMHPDMEKRITPEGYDEVSSKFVAEYGYPGPCRKKTIERYFGGHPVDRASEIWSLHNNTFEKHTVAAGIKKHYTDPESLTLEQYLLYASAVQALMLGYSLESIRSLQDCGGALFWMYNDCWGETGWTIIDYYLRRKPSWYAVKRAFTPRKLVLRETDGHVNVHVLNDTAETLDLDIEYGYVSFDGSVCDIMMHKACAQPCSKSITFTFKAEGRDDRAGVWFARAQGMDTAILRRHAFRQLSVKPAKVMLANFRSADGTVAFDVTADTFAHAVHFGLGDEALPSDEYFDLLPGETKRVRIKTGISLPESADALQAYIIDW